LTPVEALHACAHPQADLERLPDILLGVSPAELARMQRALASVWHRFLWSSLPMFQDVMAHAYASHAASSDSAAAPNATAAALLPSAVFRDPSEDDVFATIMQWLGARTLPSLMA
jgi:hypothetical protein